MRVFFNIPRLVPVHGTQSKQSGQGESLEQYLQRIGPTGRRSMVSDLQEKHLQQRPYINLQDPETKMELALIDRLIFPTLESGKLPAEDELKKQISDLENSKINNLQELEEALIGLVQEAYRRGVKI